ncbi:hypothetical protein KSP35_15945 [Aquihabitans sp. G128]|uniref:hypothetical protein n=1 Tax=Aquihabitans sp. G128 TaxID=2849779 RepID=UPI001C23E36B|nr:hypothetical protein [Aquihabitans sp. G128]QXC59860.1 hypothetical protein KSP35_15945 [Aquihabitans sp. G128]
MSGEARLFRLDGRVVSVRPTAAGQIELRTAPHEPATYLVVDKASRSRLSPDVVRLPVTYPTPTTLRLHAYADGECGPDHVGAREDQLVETADSRADRRSRRATAAKAFLADLRAQREPVL